MRSLYVTFAWDFRNGAGPVTSSTWEATVGIKNEHWVADLASLPAVRCPCGWARRAFADLPGAASSLHRVEIAEDARAHYHRDHTETYYILECEPGAAVELDGEAVPVKPGMAVLIPIGVRHRAIGRITILNIVVPPFDPADEWFDEKPV